MYIFLTDITFLNVWNSIDWLNASNEVMTILIRMYILCNSKYHMLYDIYKFVIQFIQSTYFTY